MKKLALIIILILSIVPAVMADKGHMTVLAVTETLDGLKGAEADLDLEIKSGSGKVFISTYPLTKVDTQISFRMAKEFACDFLDKNCDKYDFFYEVRSAAPIVGGPSAGGAATALTIIVLEDLRFDQGITVTGTINSGGIIGPVAGIQEKIIAAGESKMGVVLIPEGKRYLEIINQTNNTNKTIDMVEVGSEHGVDVREVAEINQVIYEMTGKRYYATDEVLEIEPQYEQTMTQVAGDLCKRSVDILFDSQFNNFPKHQKIFEKGNNLTESAKQALDREAYYSAASFCFGANVQYQYLKLLTYNLSDERILRFNTIAGHDVNRFANQVATIPKHTISDLQTYLVVSERLKESQEHLSESKKLLIDGNRNQSLKQLALGIERLYSAQSWAEFFGQEGKEFEIGEEDLRKFCLDKLAEAQERVQYANSFFPMPLFKINEDLKQVKSDMQNQVYELCIYRASKVKARTNLILSVIGLSRDDMKRMLNRKLEISKRTIVRETKRDVFPILGYSYYEYAKSLQQDDPESAILYSEYALELSNFDMYFNHEKKIVFGDLTVLAIQISVIIVVISVLIYMKMKNKLFPNMFVEIDMNRFGIVKWFKSQFKEKFICDYCGRSLKTKSAKTNHEKACRKSSE
ncbi:MAG: Lon protease [Candidatus Woesearchaeota archaeon]|nr:Lon protease [Candidatus Woesearchaeota archaeon]